MRAGSLAAAAAVGKPELGGWATATPRQRRAWLMRMAARCARDGRFKPRPSSYCTVCGDSPIQVNQCPHECDRENGWDWCA